MYTTLHIQHHKLNALFVVDDKEQLYIDGDGDDSTNTGVSGADHDPVWLWKE